jgi:hypothetical protein
MKIWRRGNGFKPWGQFYALSLGQPLGNFFQQFWPFLGKRVRPKAEHRFEVGFGSHVSEVDSDFSEFVGFTACEPDFFA